LPSYDHGGHPFSPEKLNRVKSELTRSFGEITMFKRAPAEGISAKPSGVVHDEIVIFEVLRVPAHGGQHSDLMADTFWVAPEWSPP